MATAMAEMADMAEAERLEASMNRDAIDFFRSLVQYKTSAGKSTRPTNFAGHIGRHMGSALKNWFLAKYPYHSDFVKFFHENDDVFVYDYMSGEVKLRVSSTQYVRPRRLAYLEIQCSDPSVMDDKLAENVCELELFLHVFRELVTGYEFAKTTQISANRMVDVLVLPRNEYLVEHVAHIVADPRVDPLEFGADLLSYLADNYSSMITADTKKRTITLQSAIVETLMKVRSKMDDTVYEVLKHLVAKYLAANGPTDVDQLRAAIADRHNTIIGHIFGFKPNDDYTFFDFVQTYNELFGYKLVVSSTGQKQRMISLKPRPPVDSEPRVVDINLNNETIDSDDEIYIEDSDEEVYNEEVDSDEEIYEEEETAENDKYI